MKYSKILKCGQWWLVEDGEESKLMHNLGKCEKFAERVVNALNFQDYVRGLKSKIDKFDQLDALDHCKAQKNVSSYNELLCDIRDETGEQ